MKIGLENGQRSADLLRLLVIDAERNVREALRQSALALGFQCASAESPGLAFQMLEQAPFDIVLLDLCPGHSDVETLINLKLQHPRVLVIVTTAYATVQAAVHVMRNGAFDLIGKPFELAELRAVLERAASAVTLAEEDRVLRETVKQHQSFGNLIGESATMEKVYHLITKVAKSKHPVLIHGESGTGKELVARQIHVLGPHREKPFLPVDCGSLVPTLIESELFGYVKGAFTGAMRSKEGLLQIAEGGTVFLDEIAELPIDLQAKLLRALQEKEIRPVGSTKTVPLNVRILAATNRELEQAVEQGTFRKDLYFRLNVVHPILIHHFLERINRSSGIERTFAPEALQTMMEYDWPGNVRELENVVERAGALTSGPLIQVSDLPTQLRTTVRSLEPEYAAVMPIAEMERQAIKAALQHVNGDKLKAAKLLGIGKTTLYRKLKEYGNRGEGLGGV
jgi:two-component system response regulator HydG